MTTALENAAVIGDELALSFADGTEAFLELGLMRRACPCAVCQGEPDVMGRVMRPIGKHGPNAFEVLRFEIVGGYAIQIHWGDGHSTGIYSYSYLKRLAELPPV